MKIIGIGKAIVNVICKVEDNFLTNNGLTKSTMKLIFDESEFKKLSVNEVWTMFFLEKFFLNHFLSGPHSSHL